MKILFLILSLAAAAYGSLADAQEIEYKEYIKAERPFMTFDNPAWTREDMLIKRAMVGNKPELQTANNKEYIFKDKDSVDARFNSMLEDYVKIPEKYKNWEGK